MLVEIETLRTSGSVRSNLTVELLSVVVLIWLRFPAWSWIWMVNGVTVSLCSVPSVKRVTSLFDPTAPEMLSVAGLLRIEELISVIVGLRLSEVVVWIVIVLLVLASVVSGLLEKMLVFVISGAVVSAWMVAGTLLLIVS